MVLPLVEGPLVGTMKGIPEEEAVVEELDEVEVAEVGVAIETAFHQGVGLLLILLSDPGARGSPKHPEGSPKAARICDMFGFSDMIASELEVEALEL